MAQTAVCNRHHSADEQLCRWLLLSLDRLSSDKLTMTQELIANMRGVRREGVTEAADKLQKLGVIKYCRGEIAVLDRPRLEPLCCECYAGALPEIEDTTSSASAMRICTKRHPDAENRRLHGSRSVRITLRLRSGHTGGRPASRPLRSGFRSTAREAASHVHERGQPTDFTPPFASTLCSTSTSVGFTR
jgi:hypothetical protein